MPFVILGSQPDLSFAELHFVIPDFKLIARHEAMAVLDTQKWKDRHLMDLLGGTVKLGDILLETALNDLDPETVVEVLTKNRSPQEDARALDFGWTVYGPKAAQTKLKHFPIQIKKQLKHAGWSTRWVTGKGHQPLTPAAVAKCKLTNLPHADLCVLAREDRVFLGRTTQVQDADAWSLRDYGRPFRDQVNGMLPPKLARMMVNMAGVPAGGTIIDPFCGSGSVLMEAALATSAKTIIGSDIEPRFADHAKQNLTWLVNQEILRPSDLTRCNIFSADVRDLRKHLRPRSLDAVVTEGWLGPPLKGSETRETLMQNARAILTLWKQTLAALHPLLKPTARLVIITPSFETSRGRASVDLAAHLLESGYDFLPLPDEGSNQGPMLRYRRPDQFIQRNIQILKPCKH